MAVNVHYTSKRKRRYIAQMTYSRMRKNNWRTEACSLKYLAKRLQIAAKIFHACDNDYIILSDHRIISNYFINNDPLMCTYHCVLTAGTTSSWVQQRSRIQFMRTACWKVVRGPDVPNAAEEAYHPDLRSSTPLDEAGEIISSVSVLWSLSTHGSLHLRSSLSLLRFGTILDNCDCSDYVEYQCAGLAGRTWHSIQPLFAATFEFVWPGTWLSSGDAKGKSLMDGEIRLYYGKTNGNGYITTLEPLSRPWIPFGDR
jgi:hypothetical protein